MWSLIILFILYHSIEPLYLNGGGNAAHKLIPIVGGPGGVAVTLWSPPLAAGFGGSAPEAKNKCKISL